MSFPVIFQSARKRHAAPPAAPSNLVATTASDSQIDLTWTDNSSDETSFSLERSPDNAVWAGIASPAAGATSYSDTGLDPETLYYYRIRAVRDGVESDFSNTDSDTTDAIPAPSNLTATTIDHDHKFQEKERITWTSQPLETTLCLFRPS